MGARERMEELWRQITAMDQEYERLEEELRRVTAEQGSASPEAEVLSKRLRELGGQLFSLYEERKSLLER